MYGLYRRCVRCSLLQHTDHDSSILPSPDVLLGTGRGIAGSLLLGMPGILLLASDGSFLLGGSLIGLGALSVRVGIELADRTIDSFLASPDYATVDRIYATR